MRNRGTFVKDLTNIICTKLQNIYTCSFRAQTKGHLNTRIAYDKHMFCAIKLHVNVGALK